MRSVNSVYFAVICVILNPHLNPDPFSDAEASVPSNVQILFSLPVEQRPSTKTDKDRLDDAFKAFSLKFNTVLSNWGHIFFKASVACFVKSTSVSTRVFQGWWEQLMETMHIYQMR